MAWASTGLNLTGPPGPEGPRGAKGDTGSSVTIVGSVTNPNQLPPSAVEGDGYITQDTGHLWVWSGTEWNDIGLVRGPDGPEGPPGPTGPAGADGRSVTSATVNENGNLVLTFSDASTRDAGAVRGPRGETGATGGVGPPGETGEPGPAGAPGSQWLTGSGTPGMTAAAGDLYLDLTTGDVWRFS